MNRQRVSWEIKDFIARGTPLSEGLYGFTLETRLVANEGRESKLRPVTFSVVRNIDRHSNQFMNYLQSRSVIKDITIQRETISDTGALLSRTPYSASDTRVTFRGIPSAQSYELSFEQLTCRLTRPFSREG